MSSDNFWDDKLILIQQKHDPNGDNSLKKDRLKAKNNYRRDLSNICFLMFLYLLQGVPIGLMFSLPYILSEKKSSYNSQGLFSLAAWPYSMKLLWAPVVDSFYSRRFGRRKSWLVPVQYMIGLCMLFFSNYVHDVLETRNSVNLDNDVQKLTLIFFLFTFLSATQDIAVDGWGLTILSKENLEWASICNNAGATAGVVIGNTLFLVLESKNFCNDYIRPILGLQAQMDGIVDLKGFMNFFGIVYIISTTLIFFFKTEEKTKSYDSDPENSKISIKETYVILWNILKLYPVREFIVILFTCKIAFATSGIRHLKMIEAGVPKEKLSIMNTPFQIIQILTPIFFGNASKPLELFLKVYPLRMLLTLILAVFVWLTPFFENTDHHYSWSFFAIYFILNGVYSLIFAVLSLTKTMFFTQISDKSIGGTYMTLMNTISNIGVNWPSTLALYLVDTLSFKRCESTLTSKLSNSNVSNRETYIKTMQLVHMNTCSDEHQVQKCFDLGGECIITVDAYYTLTGGALILGAIWLYHFSGQMLKLQSLPKSKWRVFKTNKRLDYE